MKKILLIALGVICTLTLFACGNKMSVGGSSYDSDLVTSGYYLDKASLSDAAFIEALSNVTEIKRPDSLGKVELPDFSTIEIVDEPVEEVTDEMVEAELEKERDAEATYAPVTTKRKAKLTDKVIIDFKGYLDGKEFDGGAAEDFELVLGSGQFIPGFEEKVVGHNAGAPFNIKVTFPENYPSEELAGKDATFAITIKSIEEATRPEIDNLFVVNHTKKGSYNVEEYKEELRERLQKRNQFMSEQSTIYQLQGELLEKSKFEPTEQALAWQFSSMISAYKKQAEENGTNIATLFASSGQSVEDAYKEMKSYAPEMIKSEMLYDELSKRYKVQVTEEEAKEEFELVAEMYNFGDQMKYDDYVKMIGLDNLIKSVKSEKLLLEAAKLCKHVTKEEK